MAPDQQDFIPTIGLEIHIQLNTDSKIFCADSTRLAKDPNTHISPVTMGLPGALPVVNAEAINMAIKLGLACNSEIADEVVFDRKNYMYPDLPKGYQITQDRRPICKGGSIPVGYNTGNRWEVDLIKIHLEEDAGKSIHDKPGNKSMIDLNRAGMPLLELVTAPVINSPEDAQAVMIEVRRLVQYLNISTGNMEEGALRCDANVSLRMPQQDELGAKVEIKNLNSFRFVKMAIQNEIVRQRNLLLSGESIISETRDFIAKTGLTQTLREKETLNDYRYFPEPDMPPVKVDNQAVEELRAALPTTAWQYFENLTESLSLSVYDAGIIIESREMASFFVDVVTNEIDPKSAANWLLGPIKSYLNQNSLEFADLPLDSKQFIQLVNLVDEEQVSFSIASNKLLPKMLESPGKMPLDLANELGLIQNANEEDISSLVAAILAENPNEVERYRNGRKELIGMFMGKVMRAGGGNINPKQAKAILEKELKST